MVGVFTVEVVLGLRRFSSQKGLREVGVGTTDRNVLRHKPTPNRKERLQDRPITYLFL